MIYPTANYFPDGGTQQPQPTAQTFKKFGQVPLFLFQLKKRGIMERRFLVSGIDDELTTNGNVFDLYKGCWKEWQTTSCLWF